jgi:hypothetical protein
MTQASASGSLVFMYAPDPYCHFMEGIRLDIFDDPELSSRIARMIPVRLEEVATGTPAGDFLEARHADGREIVIVAEPDGSELLRIDGMPDAKDLCARLDLILEHREEIARYRKEFAAGKYGNSVYLVRILTETGGTVEAVEVFRALQENMLLSNQVRERLILGIAARMTIDGEYRAALGQVSSIENSSRNPENIGEARFLHAAILLHTRGEEAAMAYLGIHPSSIPESGMADR